MGRTLMVGTSPSIRLSLDLAVAAEAEPEAAVIAVVVGDMEVVVVDMEVVVGAVVATEAGGATEVTAVVVVAAEGEIADMMADLVTREAGVVLMGTGEIEERPIRSAAYGTLSLQ